MVSCIAISATAIYVTNKSKEYNPELYNKIYEEFEKIGEFKEDYSDTMNIDKEIIDKINNLKQSENVIGKIKIDKIGIEYPILSETTDELMKIAPTKYCGPRPNGVGNLVLMGHNFYDGTQFSNLNYLVNGDKIEITDMSGEAVTYRVYEKSIIEPTDFSCTLQNTDVKCIVTLITCINGTDNRLVVKCKE